MCLYTKQICPLRARKDIVCYKKFIKTSNLLLTPFVGYAVLNDLPRKIQIPDQNAVKIVEPVHPNSFYRRRVFGGMFHACAKLNRAVGLRVTNPFGGITVVIKCIIPKGTLYYKGIYSHDICARTLILQEICGNQDSL